MSIYKNKIRDITGADDIDAKYIEDIMRNDIFHSTLDWQSPQEFFNGARQGLKLLKEYRADPDLAKHFGR